MLINVGGFFLEKEVETTPDSTPEPEVWRVRALKQLWLDQPDFEFQQSDPVRLSRPTPPSWPRGTACFKKLLASHDRRAASWNKITKLAPPGDIRCPSDPWKHARRSAVYADLIRGLRSSMIEGGYWCRMERAPLDDDGAGGRQHPCKLIAARP